jgi:hypothetical protein
VARVRSLNVGTASAETVGLAKALTVGGAYAVTVGATTNTAVAGASLVQVGGSRIEVVGALREEHVAGNYKRTVAGESTLEAHQQLSLRVGKELHEEVEGNWTQHVEKAHVTLAKEMEWEAEKFTVSVGGKVILTMEKSGAVQLLGKAITLDGAPFKASGAKVKYETAGSGGSGKGGEAQSLSKDDAAKPPSISGVGWGKKVAPPNHPESWPPAPGVPPGACVSLDVALANVPDGEKAQISIHHCVTGAQVKGGLLKGLLVKANKVVDPKTGLPPTFTFDAASLPWDPWDMPFFFFRVSVPTRGLSAQSPSDHKKEEGLRASRTRTPW